MKVFIVGLPNSGRTTVAKALAEKEGSFYIDACSWVRNGFRKQADKEPDQKFQDEYFHYVSDLLKRYPDMVSDYIRDRVEDCIIESPHTKIFVIDGLHSPKDIVSLFDYNEDYIVFLNRTDSDTDYKDYESIGVSVTRDYCYWLSSANLLNKERWLEFNFKIPGEDSNFIKVLGSKNTVMIVKSINKVISILDETLYNRG